MDNKKPNGIEFFLLSLPVVLLVSVGAWLQNKPHGQSPQQERDAALTTGESSFLRVYPDSVDKSPVEYLNIYVPLHYPGETPSWWGSKVTMWIQNPRFVSQGGQFIPIRSFIMSNRNGRFNLSAQSYEVHALCVLPKPIQANRVFQGTLIIKHPTTYITRNLSIPVRARDAE